MNDMIYRHMSYGLYIVSTMDGDRPVGCIANSIMQITAQPATIAVSLNHDNFTNSCIDKSGIFSFSIMAENSDPGLIGRFGFQSSKTVDKYDGLDYEMVSGVPTVRGTCGYIICRVINKMETSTHTVFLGEVIDGDIFEGAADAMTYAYYHKVIKGKAPKNAPTYLPSQDGEAPVDPKAEAEEKRQQTVNPKWRCTVCGYVYEGAELPADFTCPVCGVDADLFEQIS